MNKKGFTLIELLAVILILGIIALIAIPTVTKIIEESKKGAFKTTVQNLLSAAEQDCQLAQLRGESLSKTYTFTNGKVNIPLNIKGDLPEAGTITVDDSCNVSATDLSDGTFTASKSVDSDEILISKNGEIAYTCIRATELHQEECTQANNDWGLTERYNCYNAGYTESGSKGTTITYGNKEYEKGKLKSGDAFDCDVNGDGTYDYETERFYYVSDYYDTTKNEFDSKKATLIYYNNTAAGLANNTSASLDYYQSGGDVWLGPVTAITLLPTKEQWTNPNLITGTRAIIGANGENSVLNWDDEIVNLPTSFDYSNYAARLLTTQELSSGCNNLTIGSNTFGELDVCNYLLENTVYSFISTDVWGYWLENPIYSFAGGVWAVGSARSVELGDSSSNDFDGYSVGVRPAITVLKDNISY